LTFWDNTKHKIRQKIIELTQNRQNKNDTRDKTRWIRQKNIMTFWDNAEHNVMQKTIESTYMKKTRMTDKMDKTKIIKTKLPRQESH